MNTTEKNQFSWCPTICVCNINAYKMSLKIKNNPSIAPLYFYCSGYATIVSKLKRVAAVPLYFHACSRSGRSLHFKGPLVYCYLNVGMNAFYNLFAFHNGNYSIIFMHLKSCNIKINHCNIIFKVLCCKLL